MNMNTIIEEIDAEIARLEQAKAVLQSVDTVLNAPDGSLTGKRTLSPQARKAIGDAQRKRWKLAKKAKKTIIAPSAVQMH